MDKPPIELEREANAVPVDARRVYKAQAAHEFSNKRKNMVKTLNDDSSEEIYYRVYKNLDEMVRRRDIPRTLVVPGLDPYTFKNYPLRIIHPMMGGNGFECTLKELLRGIHLSCEEVFNEEVMRGINEGKKESGAVT